MKFNLCILTNINNAYINQLQVRISYMNMAISLWMIILLAGGLKETKTRLRDMVGPNKEIGIISNKIHRSSKERITFLIPAVQ
jgi:hypothetical protein